MVFVAVTDAEQIEGFEDRRFKAYPDPLTKGAPWTIGVGHCGPDVKCDTVWTPAKVQATFDADMAAARAECARRFSWLDNLNEPRKAVLVGMCFQLGGSRLAQFKLMLNAVMLGMYLGAAEEMRSSLWAKQTPKRALRLADQMETGEWR